MKKLDELRAAIVVALPDLADTPDAFLVFADQGAIVATTGKTKDFEYRYTANLILTDFGGDPDSLMFSVMEWARVNQRELLENNELNKTAIGFEVDQLTNSTADVSIKLNLTESVRVTFDDDNKPTFEHKAEEIPEWEKSGLFAE